AEHTRALDHGWRYQLEEERRRLVLLAQARIAVEHRERDKGPALMADGAKISVEDEMQRLLAAVVGMHAPADVRQQAGGMPQAAVFVGLPQFHGTDQAVGP